MPAEWKEDDLLSILDLAKYLGGISEKTVERMVEARICPRPIVLTKDRVWRWSTVKRWLEAVEFLQQNSLLLPGTEDKRRHSEAADDK